MAESRSVVTHKTCSRADVTVAHVTSPLDLMETTDSTSQATALLTLLANLVQELHPGRAAPVVTLASRLEQDLGMDSLARVELLLRIERELGLTAAEDAALGAQTAIELLHLLGVKTALTATARAQPEGESVAIELPHTAKTLSDVLRWHAEHNAQRPYLTFYAGDDRSETLNFGELYAGATQVAGGLIERDVQPGQVIALMLPSGLEFFFAFYGILLAGAVPAPLYPPASRAQLEDHLHRQIGILDNAQAPLLISVDEARDYTRVLRSQCSTLRDICTVAELRAGESASPTPLSADALGLIQYTSGSTGQPKGVMLTHANLLANVRAMGEAAAATSDDVFVSWLPLYHDMGLIGACLGSLYYGMQLILMSPLSFIARPIRWLHAIHRHGGTLSAAPNFAYQLCAARLDDAELAGVDLSRWRLAFNGAEPVHPETLEHFCHRFEVYGFARSAMTPVYGLAENAVGLAFPPLHRGARVDTVDRERFARTGEALPSTAADALHFVSGGRALPLHYIRIVDDAGRELPERRQGRLQFRGPSATQGYFRNAEATATLMHGDWRDSGDFAYLADGEAFITGRAKDLIIRAGRNIYPYELEQAVGELAGVRKNAVAVFASRGMGPAEELVVLAETRERDSVRREELRAQIDMLALQLTGSRPDRVLLAPPRSVLKTSSGKIRRVECRQLYEQGAFTDAGVQRRRYWHERLRLVRHGLGTTIRRGLIAATEHLYVGYAWACFILCGIPATLLILLLPNRRLVQMVARVAARIALSLAGIRVRRADNTRLPHDRPLVLVSNHASYMDVIILAATLDVPLHFVAKRSLKTRYFGHVLQRLGTEFVARNDVRQSVDDAERLLARVHQGDGVVFFPEATFTASPGLRPFRLGAFKVAAASGAPVVPIAVRGSRAILRGESRRPHPGRVTVWVGAPIPSHDNSWPGLIALRDRARAEILAHCGEPDLADQVTIALPEWVRP
ncbi:MAG TPA: AMP-binding protein [Gammaproteobacteria bacterium]|nr:AMP-binding protein [Gammaproteobacteria bacterium]